MKHPLKLNSAWLESVCCEFSHEGRTPNPYFNPGIRARLRRGLERPEQESNQLLTGYLSRAGWSADSPLSSHIPYQITCSVFAWHPHAWHPPEEKSEKWKRPPNLGSLCRLIAMKRQEKPNSNLSDPTCVSIENNSFTPRFERILSCRRPVQMIPHLRAVVRLLSPVSPPPLLDFNGLLKDLSWWQNDWADEKGPRLRWAREYWRETETVTKEEPITQTT